MSGGREQGECPAGMEAPESFLPGASARHEKFGEGRPCDVLDGATAITIAASRPFALD